MFHVVNRAVSLGHSEMLINEKQDLSPCHHFAAPFHRLLFPCAKDALEFVWSCLCESRPEFGLEGIER